MHKSHLMAHMAVAQTLYYAQAVNGMYLAATRGQRQHFPVLGIYGFSVGYPSIISSPAKTAKDATVSSL
jgi:hypothetical protein